MKISEIIKRFSKDMTSIPYFIDTKEHEDHMLWIEMMILNNLLLDMVTSRIFNRKEIYLLWLDFQEQYNSISDAEKIIEVYDYYKDLITYMLEVCIEEEELFESAANIQKFIDLN